MRSPTAAWLLAVALVGAACHKMTALTLDDVDRLRPSRIWVTDADQSMFEMSGPQVFNDTIVGYVNGEFSELPAQAVRRMTIREPARGKTIALAAAGTIAAAGLIWMVAGGGIFSDPKSGTDCDDDPENPVCQGQGP
jgi:hypothetical protein